MQERSMKELLHGLSNKKKEKSNKRAEKKEERKVK
jgi:hypothetical protein